MLRRTIGTLALLAGILGMVCAAPLVSAADTDKQAKQKVVIQVSDGDPKTWNQALNVVKNVQKAYGKDKVDVRLVVFGNGIGMLKMDSVVANRIEDTAKAGVHVLACQNTMRGRKLVKDDMLATIGYVPAGVIDIINKQKQGWAVVRP